MHIRGIICFILFLCSVFEFYNKIFEYPLGFFLMDCVTCLKLLNLKKSDFVCGFSLSGSFAHVFKVFGLFLLFGIGLRFLQINLYYNNFSKILCDFRGKSCGLRKGLYSESDFDAKYSSKDESCKGTSSKLSKKLSTSLIDNVDETKDDDVQGEQELYDEDEEFDVLALRKLIKIERRKGNKARADLEKERMAASSAAEETMAMILRLQNEKSLIEMEANQFKRLAEEKQHHDQEVIQSLQWLLSKHESERNLLETHLKLCRKKLNIECEDSEEFEVSSKATFEEALNDAALFSSLDMNSSPSM